MASFDFTSPKRLFQSLIQPVAFDNFFGNYWENKPLILHRNKDLSSVAINSIKSIFSKEAIKNILINFNLQCEADVNVYRYKENKQEPLNEKGRMTIEKLEKLLSRNGASVKFCRPQRYQDELWQILEYLESFFGSLVGADIIVNPSTTQMSPPCYDNMETFILQLEGETCWKLYKTMSQLPRDSGKELGADEIGEETHDFSTRCGDLLYLPRGTVHQFRALSCAAHSTLIIISTYHQHCWGDYIMSVFPHLLDEAMKTDVDFRRGLPINFIKSTKISKTDKVQSILGILLLKLVKIRSQKFLVPESMIESFVMLRLPPYKVEPDSLRAALPEGPPPDLGCKIRLKHADHICFLIKANHSGTPTGGNEDEAAILDDSTTSSHFLSRSLLPVKEDEALFVYTSLYNNRASHLVESTARPLKAAVSSVLRFPDHYRDSLDHLKVNCDQFTVISDLPLPIASDRENLVRALWSSHLLEVIPGHRGKAVKSTKLD